MVPVHIPAEPLTRPAVVNECGFVDDPVDVVSVVREVVQKPLATVVVDLGEHWWKGGGA